MTGFLVLILQGTSYQILLGMLVTVLYTKIYSYYSPFIDASIASLKEVGQWQIFVALMLALLIQTEALRENKILTNVISVFAVFMCLLYDMCTLMLTAYIPVMKNGNEIKACLGSKDQNVRITSIDGVSVRDSDVNVSNPMNDNEHDIDIDRESGWKLTLNTPRNSVFEMQSIDKEEL